VEGTDAAFCFNVRRRLVRVSKSGVPSILVGLTGKDSWKSSGEGMELLMVGMDVYEGLRCECERQGS